MRHDLYKQTVRETGAGSVGTMTAIWWIRRDLRVDDNVALDTATELGHGTVIPLFVLDPA
ncbi:MAG: deoxyribodipyrimidine photo-lyase, partial [Chloroflexota bacterium]